METKTGDYPFVNIYKAHAWQPCAKTVCGAVRERTGHQTQLQVLVSVLIHGVYLSKILDLLHAQCLHTSDGHRSH